MALVLTYNPATKTYSYQSDKNKNVTKNTNTNVPKQQQNIYTPSSGSTSSSSSGKTSYVTKDTPIGTDVGGGWTVSGTPTQQAAASTTTTQTLSQSTTPTSTSSSPTAGELILAMRATGQESLTDAYQAVATGQTVQKTTLPEATPAPTTAPATAGDVIYAMRAAETAAAKPVETITFSGLPTLQQSSTGQLSVGTSTAPTTATYGTAPGTQLGLTESYQTVASGQVIPMETGTMQFSGLGTSNATVTTVGTPTKISMIQEPTIQLSATEQPKIKSETLSMAELTENFFNQPENKAVTEKMISGMTIPDMSGVQMSTTPTVNPYSDPWTGKIYNPTITTPTAKTSLSFGFGENGMGGQQTETNLDIARTNVFEPTNVALSRAGAFSIGTGVILATGFGGAATASTALGFGTIGSTVLSVASGVGSTEAIKYIGTKTSTPEVQQTFAMPEFKELRLYSEQKASEEIYNKNGLIKGFLIDTFLPNRSSDIAYETALGAGYSIEQAGAFRRAMQAKSVITPIAETTGLLQVGAVSEAYGSLSIVKNTLSKEFANVALDQTFLNSLKVANKIAAKPLLKAGFQEGGASYLVSTSANDRTPTWSGLAFSSVAGAASAYTLGILPIAGNLLTKAPGTKNIVTRGGTKTVEFIGNVLDTTEKPSDIIASKIYKYETPNILINTEKSIFSFVKPKITTIVPSISTSTPTFSFSGTKTPSNVNIFAPTNVKTPSNVPLFSTTNGRTPSNVNVFAPTNVRTPSNVNIRTPTNVGIFTPVNIRTPVNVRTPSNVPVFTPTNVRTPTPVNVRTPTNVPVFTPTSIRTPTNVPVDVPVPIPVPVIVPTGGFLPLPILGSGGGLFGGGATRRKLGYQAGFKATVKKIKQKGAAKKYLSGMQSGQEFRAINI